MKVLERTSRHVMVSLSARRWDRLMELEEAYRVAKCVTHAKRECATAPSMSVSEALQFIDSL